ncbi:hypothetical protein [Limnobacter sp.]|uniref:hypothetical protein n=1 Tax=Limnobacter sp. TaxID=2003368 RepID=UPI0035159EF7
MNTRRLIATSVLAFSASLPAVVLANPATQQGDGTGHVYSASNVLPQATRQAVLNEYKKAVKNGDLDIAAGDASIIEQTFKSTVTRAEVLSKIDRVDLTQGDAT